MQPTYQVPWPKLASACAGFKEGVTGEDFNGLLPLLFLCGLKFQFSYYFESRRAGSQLKHAGAGHLVDDGLDQACQRGLRSLMRLCKSRTTRELLKDECFNDLANKEWFVLSIAFLELFDELTPTVKQWIEHGHKQTNQIRFSFGMGVKSFWRKESQKFVHKMVKQQLIFVNEESLPCTDKVKEILATFEWSAEWVLPEV